MCLERRFEFLTQGVDARIVLGVVHLQRRLDVLHLVGVGSATVKRRARIQFPAHFGGEKIGGATAPAEAGCAQLAVRQLVTAHITGAVDHVLLQLRVVEGPLHGPPVIVVTRVATKRRQAVRRQR